MTTVNELKDVSEEEVERKVAEYESLGYKVEKIKQPDGKWTVRATDED